MSELTVVSEFVWCKVIDELSVRAVQMKLKIDMASTGKSKNVFRLRSEKVREKHVGGMDFHSIAATMFVRWARATSTVRFSSSPKVSLVSITQETRYEKRVFRVIRHRQAQSAES